MSQNLSQQNTISIKHFIIYLINCVISLLLAIAVVISFNLLHPIPRIAYVDSNRLMVGFSESSKIQNELKAENDKWQKQMKVLEDSLQATVNTMSKEYDKAAPAKKKELQDILSARNQQMNNFKQANMKRMEKMQAEKMQTVFDKINVFIKEYGKKHGYSIIFGAVGGGTILYGNENSYDITDEIIKGLNERYK